jgi:hypothetical protein
MTATITDYEAFLRAKFDFHADYGFDVDPADLSPCLLPHQRDIVRWAIKGGRRAIFASFGLGKSVIQLEILRLIVAHLAGEGHRARALIVCPLGVRQEFVRDARDLLGLAVTFVRHSAEVAGDGIYLTNYESIRDGRLDPDLFDAVSLDEASVLRSYGSKTYQGFLQLFRNTTYRFVATATPSPNKYKELIHYSAFLGIMDSGQALTRWFQRDSTKANNLTLFPHKAEEFHVWLHSWAIFLLRPSDLGYSDSGYDLPELEVIWHELPNKAGEGIPDRDGQGRIFRDSALGVSAAAREKRDTLPERVAQLMALVDAHQKGIDDQPGLLRGEQGAGKSPSSSIQAGQSGEGEGITAAVCAVTQRPGNTPRLRQRLLSSEQSGSDAPSANLRTEETLRVDQGGLRIDADRTERIVLDLPKADGAASRRPRSRNRSGTGAAVPPVQHGNRVAGGRSSDVGEGDRVSDQIVIWCDLNDEQTAIERALDARGLTYSSIDGSMPTEEAEQRMEEWRDRRTYALIGKPVMLGQGVNLQQCNRAIFVGVTHKFNNVIQASHRIHRFGQTRPCRVDFIYAESEREVVKTLRRKWAQHKELTAQMSDLIRKHGLDQVSIAKDLERSLGIERVEMSGEGWAMVNNDCVAETSTMEAGSVGLVVTSIPFANQYEYTPSYNDFGHTESNEHFWAQMDFLTPELLRILQPGRIYACHVKDRINFGNVTGAGYSTVSPFHAEAIMHGIGHGFEYMGMVTVVTDVVRENNQSYRLGWSENAKDGTKMGVGSPEYVLLFRKPQTDRTRGYADEPVVKSKDDYSRARWQIDAHAFWRTGGNRLLTAEDMRGLSTGQRMKLFEEWTLHNLYDYEVHVRIGEDLDGKAGMGVLPATFMMLAPASPHPDVWTDINRMRTLNSEQARRNLAMHVCPLQLEITDRLIERYSNPGDLVVDPFAGLGTVPVRALRLGRRGRGVELNPEYFGDAVRYLTAEEMRAGTPSLFDLIEMETAGVAEAAAS